MNAPDPIRCGFEHRPVDWSFPVGETWVTGWIDADRHEGLADVRAWIDGQIFLGLFDLPFEPGQDGVPGRHRFALLVEAGRKSRLLRLEAWSAGRGWAEFFQTAISGPAITANGRPAKAWVNLLPRFVRGMAKCSDRAIPAVAEEAVQSALAKPLNILPAPPFFGALETPTGDGYVRDGKLLVSGWLVHQTQPITKMTARIGRWSDATLFYGLQRRDVGEQFPELPGGKLSHFTGLVDLPPDPAEPVPLLIFAETPDGTRRLVFARRFVPWERASTAVLRPTRLDWRRLRSGWTLMAAACRHGIQWWDAAGLWVAARAPGAADQAARAAAEGPFAESTPLSLYLSSFEDHEIDAAPVQISNLHRVPDGLNVVFVLPCDFSWASALHVLALTNELARHGHDSIVAVPECLDTLADHENPACRGMLHAEAMNGVKFPDGRGPDVVHAWTLRENVRRVAERVKQVHAEARLFVHLEDNERQILAASLGCTDGELNRLTEAELDRLVSPDMAHPDRGHRFLRTADGVTVVVNTLAGLVPPGVPVRLITPAADRRYFYPRPHLGDFRRQIDPSGEATILFYSGNVHASNAAEMRELYAAVFQLNRDGVPVRLIRTGRDQVDFLGRLEAKVAPFVSELGRIRRHRHLAPLMALADMFVQPGTDNEFNASRLPSKLPEFFSIGRPVILPRTNLGLITRHRIDAYVLERADCPRIVGAVKELRADRSLYDTLSRGATEFAQRQFSWERSAGELAAFYASIMTARVETGQ